MRLALLAPVLLAATAVAASGQTPIHEYRPELVVTLPRIHGTGITLLVEQHLSMGDLAPNERIVGVGIVSPSFRRLSATVEARRVVDRGVAEYRYLPTLNASLPLPGGFEIRDRARIELRDVAGVRSRRYQNRSAVGHEVDAWDRSIFPYMQLDFSYDSRFDELNRREQSAGVRVPLWRGASIDPFLTRQSDTRRTPFLLLTAGAIMRIVL